MSAHPVRRGAAGDLGPSLPPGHPLCSTRATFRHRWHRCPTSDERRTSVTEDRPICPEIHAPCGDGRPSPTSVTRDGHALTLAGMERFVRSTRAAAAASSSGGISSRLRAGPSGDGPRTFSQLAASTPAGHTNQPRTTGAGFTADTSCRTRPRARAVAFIPPNAPSTRRVSTSTCRGPSTSITRATAARAFASNLERYRSSGASLMRSIEATV